MNKIHAIRSNLQSHVNTLFKMSLLLVATFLFSGTAAAHCISNKLYAGAGLTFNAIDNYENDATGFQIFGGYCLNFNKQNPHVRSAIEIGYMDSGDFKRDALVKQGNVTYLTTQSTSYEGLWMNLVGEFRIDQRVHLLGRIGFDTGDDDGIMAGFGLGLNISKSSQLRVEYVARDQISSTQINFLNGF